MGAMEKWFEPEFGQAMWSNGNYGEYALPDIASDWLHWLGQYIQLLRDDEGPLTINYGAEPFSNERFSMRTYCWCDGDAHPDGCPPNFEYYPLGLVVSWYKHVGRGASCNQKHTDEEWKTIVRGCAESLDTLLYAKTKPD